MYLLQLPQRPVYPCVRYQRISTVPLTTMDQSVTQWQQAGRARFQIDVYASGASGGAQTDTVVRAIATALKSFNGWSISGDTGYPNAPNLLVNRSMGIEPNTQPPLFKDRSDWMVWYREQN